MASALRTLARPAARVLLAALIGVLGAFLAMQAFGRASADLGPFRVQLDAGFGRGVTGIGLPPFGELVADTHTAPLRVDATLQDVRITELTDLFQTKGTDGVVEAVVQGARHAFPLLALRLLGLGVAGGLALGLVVYRENWRRVAVAGVAALLAVGGSEAAAWATYRPESFQHPTFSGSLTIAPKLIGPVREASSRLNRFREELGQIVSGTARVYGAIQGSPLGEANEIRVLHISDIHLSPLGMEFAQRLADAFAVDFVVDTGDISSFGLPVEDLILGEIPAFHRPYVYVRGNHDSRALQAEVGAIRNAVVLDGQTVRLDGLTLYGLGDPVFTPNRAAGLDDAQIARIVEREGSRVAADVAALPRPPDVVAVHDDRMAESVAGRVPLVISGHFHVPSALVESGTLFLRVGSTGGAGPKVFVQQGGIPLSAEILHFAPATAGSPPKLIAYDLVSQSPETGSITVQRHLIAVDFGALSPTPSPSGTPAGVPTSPPESAPATSSALPRPW